MKILCKKDVFVVRLGSRIPADARTGALLFRRYNRGFSTSHWEQYFSPEPDRYFNQTPTIDVKADRDQQWKFAPAPLNFSFATPAGWFSTGLLDLPGVTIFSFKNEALYLSYHWDKISLSKTRFFQFPPILFTFNNFPWDAVGDFSNYIYQNKLKLNPAFSKKSVPSWWRQPLVSTIGEQMVEKIAGTDSLFNSTWVREYISRQKKELGTNFTFILEDKWCDVYSDPHPSKRFRDLRAFIDWCHDLGCKVILSWKAWKVEPNSLALRHDVTDGEYIDATHPSFDEYVDYCCKILFGSGDNRLNADGIRIDDLFLVRDPGSAKYADAAKGMGIKEVYLYLAAFYKYAKKYKADALVMSSAIDPHFSPVQDMVRIHHGWYNKFRREKRARIISQAMPGMLINGDAAEMYNDLAPYHYVTSAIYGVPAVQYLTRFEDGEITEENKNLIAHILRFVLRKPEGRLKFVNYGHWQIVDRNNKILAESMPSGKGMVIYKKDKRASLLCADNNNPLLVLEHHKLLAVQDAKGVNVPFEDLGQGIYLFKRLKKGHEYQLKLKKILRVQP